MSEIKSELPNTYQTPTMAPFCKDEEKYKVVDDLVNQVQEIKNRLGKKEKRFRDNTGPIQGEICL